jgi:hypothetical protein
MLSLSNLKKYDLGIISTYLDNYSKEENTQRSVKLRAWLLKKGYCITSLDVIFENNIQENIKIPEINKFYLVIDCKHRGSLKENLIKAALAFRQKKIAFSPKNNDFVLIYPYTLKNEKLKELNIENICEVVSKIKNKLCIDIEMDKNIYGMDRFSVGEYRSIAMFAKECEEEFFKPIFVKTKNNWVKAIWEWADECNIPKEIIPRNETDLLKKEKLYLSKITYIPKEIFNLKKIRDFRIFESNIKTIPKEIGNFKNDLIER